MPRIRPSLFAALLVLLLPACQQGDDPVFQNELRQLHNELRDIRQDLSDALQVGAELAERDAQLHIHIAKIQDLQMRQAELENQLKEQQAAYAQAMTVLDQQNVERQALHQAMAQQQETIAVLQKRLAELQAKP